MENGVVECSGTSLSTLTAVQATRVREFHSISPWGLGKQEAFSTRGDNRG